jgi:hypothetical protein
VGPCGAAARSDRLGATDDKERAQASGFDYHLTTPVNPDQVLELLAAFVCYTRRERRRCRNGECQQLAWH